MNKVHRRERIQDSPRLAGIAAFMAIASCGNVSPFRSHQQLPPVAAPVENTTGPLVGLGKAMDARTSSELGSAFWISGMYNPWYLWIPQYQHWEVGSEIAGHANDLVTACLASRGFRIMHPADAAGGFVPPRIILVIVTRAHYGNPLELSNFAKGIAATADILIKVRDNSGKQTFSQTYSGANPSWEIPFKGGHFLGPGDFVSEALDDAASKACGDPAFIAAITPPYGAQPQH